MYSDQFSYIPTRLDFSWERGHVRTLDQFEAATDWVESRLHPDGHLYQIEHTMSGRPEANPVRVPNSERGALLFFVPATHELALKRVSEDIDAVRNGAGGFIIHFLGFLFGRRCQFAEWQFDVRLPSRDHSDAMLRRPRLAGLCVEPAFAVWEGATVRTRTVLTNALYMHNRAPSYEWSWERFIAEYQVFDALFSIAKHRHRVKAKHHADRFRAIADAYGIWHDEAVIKRIVGLRNDLFHEVLWGGVLPGAAADTDAYYAPLWLHHINQRLGFAVLDLTGPYISTSWQSLQTYLLDLDVFTRQKRSPSG